MTGAGRAIRYVQAQTEAWNTWRQIPARQPARPTSSRNGTWRTS